MGKSRFGKIFSVFAAVLSFVLTSGFSGCSFRTESDDPIKTPLPKESLGFLKTDGELIRNDKGKEIYLRGVNAGGLFVTEHWMTGFYYGSTASDDYKSLTQTFIDRFGEEKTKALWEEYRSNWWTDADFRNCADMGMNVIRLPFTYMNVDFAAISDYGNAGENYDFSALDSFVEKAEEYGLYTILDLHGAYGSQNGQDHSGQIFDNVADVDFYSNETMMNLTEKLWRALSEHYKDNAAVAGYDILNEPGEKAGTTSERHWDFYDRVYDAIRNTGDEHIVIFESCWEGENLPRPEDYGWKNCMYSFHHYAESTLSEVAHDVDWNNKIANVTSRNFGVPLQMGEFTSYSTAEKWDYTFDLLNRSGWHWTSWTYKVWGRMPWGIVNIIGNNSDKVNASTDDYETILTKFKVLRTDGDSAEKYAFNSVDESGQKRTLESIFKKYCGAEINNVKLEAGIYRFYEYDGNFIAPAANRDGISLFGLTDDANAATMFTLQYHSANDGSAYLSVNGRNLSVVTIGGEYYLTFTGSVGNEARFYPVAAEEGYAFVSFTACRYISIGSDGLLRAAALTVSSAGIFFPA